MDFHKISIAAMRQWETECKGKIRYPLGSARVVTGKPIQDAHIHFLETEYGIKLFFDPYGTYIERYEVVDEKKYTTFLLKWV